MNTKKLQPGSEYRYSRRISREDILHFAEISQDRGNHHVNPESRLMAHGLLIATLPTKLGGDLNFIASAFEFAFVKAVYEGETITCIAKMDSLLEQAKRYKATLSFQCINERGDLVMEGTTKGMIWK